MLSILLVRLLLVLGLVGIFFSAWLSWQNDSYKLRIKTEGSASLANRLASEDFPLLSTEPIKYFLKRALLTPDIDNNDVLKLIGVYLDRRPLDADVWLYGSNFHQRLGDKELASRYLSVAHSLSQSNTPILLKVFNRYLEIGLIDEAMPVAKDIIIAKPNEFRRLFYLMSRLSNDYERVVSEVISKEAPLQKKSDEDVWRDMYYKWGMLDSIRLKNSRLAQVVWKSMPLNLKRHSEISLRYLNYLLPTQDEEIVKSVWFDIVGREIKHGEITGDGDISPCWYIRDVEGVESSVSFPDDGRSFINIKFLGEYNIGYNHASCIVLVDPNIDYNLTWRSKGDDITTLSGPFLDVVFPGLESKYYRNDDLIGSWSLSDFVLNFRTPEEASFAKIRIRRQRTELLDSKILGAVRFSDFKLQKIVTKKNSFVE